MSAARVAVWGFDLRGHGRSAGRRGHVNSRRDYVADLACFLRMIRDQQPNLPILLFAHSLGSLIALAFVMDQPAAVSGLIVSGTAVDPVGVARPHLVAMARVLSVLWPTFTIRVSTAGRAALSRDPRVEAAFAADPLVLRGLTAWFGVEALAMVASVKQRADKVVTPILAIHGGNDPLNSLAGAREFIDRVGSSDKELIVYPGSLHEVYHDLDSAKVLTDLRKWIERHL